MEVGGNGSRIEHPVKPAAGVAGEYVWGVDGPVPSAPPMIAEPVTPPTAGGFQQPVPAAPLTPAAQQSQYQTAIGMAQQAVAADSAGDLQRAKQLYESTVQLLLQCEKAEPREAAKQKIHSFIDQYLTRLDGMRRNDRYISGKVAPDPPEPKVAPKLSSTSSSDHHHRTFGWDGSLFSGKRRGLFDSAVDTIAVARMHEAKGEVHLAKERYQQVAEALIGFLKDERDVTVSTTIGNKASEMLGKAEEMQRRIERLEKR